MEIRELRAIVTWTRQEVVYGFTILKLQNRYCRQIRLVTKRSVSESFTAKVVGTRAVALRFAL
jgi:hypothetical protein